MFISPVGFNPAFDSNNFRFEEKFHAQQIFRINLLKFITLFRNFIPSHLRIITILMCILIMNNALPIFIYALKC